MDFHWPIESIFTTRHSCPYLLSLATKDLSPHPRAILSYHALTYSSFFRFSFWLLENALSYFLPFQLLFLCPAFWSFFLFPHFGHFQSLLIKFLLLSLDDVFSGNQSSSFSNLLCVEHIQESTLSSRWPSFMSPSSKPKHKEKYFTLVLVGVLTPQAGRDIFHHSAKRCLSSYFYF